ncbi:MAG: twin transmembrane helix small protein [Dongiaceae bacterium]
MNLSFIIIAGIATIAVLFLGLFSMARGGEFNRKYGNLFMRFRVLFQAITIALVLIALFLASR